VDKELGFVSSDDSDSGQRWTYLYIRNRRVIGLVTAESIRYAFLLLDDFKRSQEKQKAIIGIHQMWVHSKFRRQGIASCLVDTVRERMVYGCVIQRDQVAFSSPTFAGASFARQYSAAGDSQDVLVYDCH
jgi:N-acetyltransferase